MSDVISANHVFLDNPSKTTEEAIEFFSDKAVELGFADDKDKVLAAFNYRENQGPTGMVNGFAIPHAKTSAVKDAAILVARFTKPIEGWKAMDSDPVSVAVALLMPKEAATKHLTILSKLAACLMDEGFRKKLVEENDPEKIAAAIDEGLAE